MSADPSAELSDVLVEDASYLPNLDDDTRREVVALCNSRIHGHAGPHDLLGLVLVMLGIRPACIISVGRSAISTEKAAEMAKDHAAVGTWDLVGQFLNAYDIPYVLGGNYNVGWPNEPAQVSLNFHVSFDEARSETYAEAHAEAEPVEHGLSRDEDEALGYPDAAIEVYCDGDHLTDGRFLDIVSDEDLDEAFGPLIDLYDALDVDRREFTKVTLPYVIPATVPDCMDRIVGDAARFLLGGVIASHEYDITLFDQVLTDYRDRFAPEE